MSEQQHAGQEAGAAADEYQVFVRADGVYLLLDAKIQKSNQDDLLKLWSHKSRIFLEYRKTILGSVAQVTEEAKAAQVIASYAEWLRSGGFKAQKKEQKLQAKAKKKQAHMEKMREKEDREQDVGSGDDFESSERSPAYNKKLASLQDGDDWFYSDEEEEGE